MIIPGLETPFSKSLLKNNRWVILADQIPWDMLVKVYLSRLGNNNTGAKGINARVVIGAMIIKHIENLSDEDTVKHIQENIYMQYFIGYSSFCPDAPFDPSLFVEFRKRMGIEQINQINEIIVHLSQQQIEKNKAKQIKEKEKEKDKEDDDNSTGNNKEEITHKGKLIADATACPQDIAYPTDLNLLNDARVKSEELIDILYTSKLHKKKPRTDRKQARKFYLKTAQKKKKTGKDIRKANKKQLFYLRRNINSINTLLDAYSEIPLDKGHYKYLLVINTLYEQQSKMHKAKTHSIEDRIVSIHQPHVRPIVRGKANANVEFGSKIQVCLMEGYAFLDDLSWDAFNEGTRLISSVEKYKKRFGYYPEEVLVDKIYCNRDNRGSRKKK